MNSINEDLKPVLERYSMTKLLEWLIEKQYINKYSARNYMIKEEYKKAKEMGERHNKIIDRLSEKYCLCQRQIAYIVYENS